MLLWSCVIDLQLAWALIRLHIRVLDLQRRRTLLAVKVPLIPARSAHNRLLCRLLLALLVVPCLAWILLQLHSLQFVLLHLLLWLRPLRHSNTLIDIAKMLLLSRLSWLDTALLRWNARQVKVDASMVNVQVLPWDSVWITEVWVDGEVFWISYEHWWARICVIACVVLYTKVLLLFSVLRNLFAYQTHFALICWTIVELLLIVLVLSPHDIFLSECFFILLDETCLCCCLETIGQILLAFNQSCQVYILTVELLLGWYDIDSVNWWQFWLQAESWCHQEGVVICWSLVHSKSFLFTLSLVAQTNAWAWW